LLPIRINKIYNTLFKAQTISHVFSYLSAIPFSIVFPLCHSKQKYEKPNTLFLPVDCSICSCQQKGRLKSSDGLFIHNSNPII